MKLYTVVKKILEDLPQARNSDRVLSWIIWEQSGLIFEEHITKSDFLHASSSESIGRVRRKIQEYYPHLRSIREVQVGKDKKEQTKGNFVYQEKIL